MIQAATQEGHPINIPSTFHNYKVIKNLGCGSTCVVFLVEDILTQNILSAKIISKKDAEMRNIVKSIHTEVKILKKINHPNIIKFYDFFEIKNHEEDEFYVIIMEYCENGDLISYVSNNGFKSEVEKKKIIKNFLEAVDFLHKNGICHGDIKSDNILLDKIHSPKLCDFGFAKTSRFANDNAKNGTLYYAAPELFQKGIFDTFKADIYAIGITLYSMSELEFPYEKDDQATIIQQIVKGQLSFKKGIDEKLRKLVEKCTSLNPEDRPTIEDIIKDEYLSLDSKDNNIIPKKISSYQNIEEISLPFFEF